MNVFVATLISIYSKLLLLYPRSFRNEFGEEMQGVFRDSVDEASKDGILFLVIVGLREMVNLPGSVLQEFWHELTKKDTIMDMNEQTESKSVIKEGQVVGCVDRHITICTVRIASIIGKIRIPFWGDTPIGILLLFFSDSDRTDERVNVTYSYLGWSWFLMVVVYHGHVWVENLWFPN
jgi:hypothetical protein